MPKATKKVQKRSEKPLRLDLGCGSNPKEGFDGVDSVKLPTTKYVADLRKRWPWKDESVTEIHSQHFLEHLTGPERIHFMNELWRVLVPSGKATIIVPYWSSIRASQDPTHQWPPISEASFIYFNRDWRRLNGLTHYTGITCNFDFVYGYNYIPEHASKTEEVRLYAASHYLNAVADLSVTLTKIPK